MLTDKDLVTPTQIRTAELDTHRLRLGFDLDQVDDLLDQAADTIEVLLDYIREHHQEAGINTQKLTTLPTEQIDAAVARTIERLKR